ncbi:MAG: restriction endonuclease subunit R [Chloroflexota bacterium]
MPKKIFAKDVTLYDLETHFNLSLNEHAQFFSEWQTDLPEINAVEQAFLDNVKTSYQHRTKYPATLANAVQITVVSPLLHLSEFLLPPFVLQTETSVQITTQDEEIQIEGRIDILMLREKIWALVIESKHAELAIKVGFPQILSYMLATPTPERPCYGMVTNGGSFIFFKVAMGEMTESGNPEYGMSRVFDLVNPENDLYSVLRIMKKIRMLA